MHAKAMISAGLIALLTAPAAAATVFPALAPAPPRAAVTSADERFEAAFAATAQGNFAPLEAVLRTERRQPLATLLRARLDAARYRPGVSRDPALLRIAATSPPSLREGALSIIMASAFADGDYGAAARAGADLIPLLRARGAPAEEVQGEEMTRRLAQLLATHPRQQVAGTVAIAATPLRRDQVGLPRIDVAVNDGPQDAVVDSGANLSVLARSAAQRLGVTVIDTATEVANGVEGTVPVRIGIAARLRIAGTELRNVPFLIIDDAQLTFPQAGGYNIRAIIGLPVLRALGRVRLDAARLAVEAPQPFVAARQNLYAATNDLFARVTLNGRAVPLHLDTGANQTSLSALFAADNAPLVASLETAEQRLGSAGGERRNQAAAWNRPLLSVAGRTVTLPAVNIALPGQPAPSRFYGTIGSDALRLFASHVIDFRAMRLEVGEPLPVAPAPARAQ